MNETTKTLTFVGIAAVALVAAFITDRASQPAQLTGYENVGEEFYPDFSDPTQAKSLRVVSYNEDSATLKVFNVEFKDGVWKIPSHHDYPADAEDELAETAASLVGVVRGALESRRKSDHERFGVIDPLDESNTNLKGRGQRLTLAKEGGAPLVDFIIGKEVPEQPNEYYVRKVDEDSVYRTKLNVDLSSEFSDWIEPDLLKVERDRLVEIIVNKYSIDERQRRIVNRELATLKRKKSTDPWELEGLNKETEKLNTSDVNQMINTLSDLKIQGIRPKPPGIAKELKTSGNLRLDPLDFVDLQSKGFILASDPQGNQQLVSNEGEVIVATNQGVLYSLYFGEIFTGSTLDIEAGNSAKKKEEKPKEKADASDSEEKKDSEEKEDEKTDDGALKTSRYLFVTVSFDPSFVGDPPQKPEEPQKSAGLKEKKAEDKKKVDTKPADKKEDTPKENTKKEEEKPTPEEEYEIAMKKYQSELKTYEKKLKEYDEKVVKGNEIVQKLNERFADWYYVISAKSFETLRMSRKALIEPIEKPKEESSKTTPPAGAGKPAAKNGKPAPKPNAGSRKPKPSPNKKPGPSKKESDPQPKKKPAKQPTETKESGTAKDPKAKPKGPSQPKTPQKN
ncbi:DUF4340 domain-containing protein [Gimesia aquarii]|uniref:DUF4340 domain-containing protein n=1 Tax=Gimesia aquarii TaxID=2527964 RepID=A0A517W1Q5_9PLAN|nr:DUF4340 domain-containing protein [Gimesia aquarii]QDT99184.1 hypothetical protein V144x_46940 [Gimesia aquarii]